MSALKRQEQEQEQEKYSQTEVVRPSVLLVTGKVNTHLNTLTRFL